MISIIRVIMYERGDGARSRNEIRRDKMRRQSHDGKAANIINGFASELSLFHLKLAQLENYRVK